MFLVAIFAGGGLLVGLLVGRWWALAAAVGFGIWLGVVEEAEIIDEEDEERKRK